MEVILREHVENLGRRGEVVKVANGYARNYLLPRKLAMLATEANKKHLERERRLLESREAEDKQAAEVLAARLSAAEVVVQRRVGEGDVLYGSVTSADVAEKLTQQGFAIDKRKVVLAEPLKAIGEFEVPIKVHREVTATVKVKVEKLEG